MTNTEFNLSGKGRPFAVDGEVVYFEEDVKEFIRRLHKLAAYGFTGRKLIEEIDKLAGDKLI